MLRGGVLMPSGKNIYALYARGSLSAHRAQIFRESSAQAESIKQYINQGIPSAKVWPTVERAATDGRVVFLNRRQSTPDEFE